MKTNNVFLKESLLRCIDNSELTHLVPEILASFKEVQLLKNDLFVAQNSVCNHFCFIESGILQHSIHIDGEEKTTYLALKNTFTTALLSFKKKIPSRKNITAISDCTLWNMSIEDFENLLDTNKAFDTFYFNLIENQIYKIDDYRIDLLTLSPEERYQKLLKSDPVLIQKVPLRYLASFLGISERHISRIRKNSK